MLKHQDGTQWSQESKGASHTAGAGELPGVSSQMQEQDRVFNRELLGWVGVAYLLTAMLTGCGGAASTPPPKISVSFGGGNSQTIGQGQSVTITATVANDPSGRGVSWTLAGPGSLSKQTSTSVEYDAPASVVTNGSATITAAAVASTTASAVYTLNLAAIVVTVSPDNVTVVANTAQPFTAAVQNDASNSGVTWTISPASGAGTLSNATKTSVTFNAPGSPPSNDLVVTITATSAATPTISASANVVVPAIVISVDPGGATVAAGTKQMLTATVANDPSNAGVVWSISPASGAGTLSDVTKTSVTFNAPASAPPSDVVVTITATSVTDATRSSPATVTVPAIAVSISPTSATVAANTTHDFTATTDYDPNNAGVTWSLSPATGVGSLGKATSTSVTYSAPADAPASNLTATLTATSATDTSKLNAVQITVPAISVSVSPSSALIPVNATQQFTGNVNYDPAGKGVTWAPVQAGASCAPACGTFSPTSTDSGMATTYTAPAAVPPVAEVDVTATSISDHTKSGIAPITLTNGTVKLVPAKLDYGHVKYRNPLNHQLLSKTLELTLTNVGSSALNISSMVATTHFTQTNDCGTSVGAGMDCTVKVIFTPGAVGVFTGTLAINDSSSDSPQVVPLSGEGVAILGHSVHAAVAAEQTVAAPAPTGPNTVGTRVAHFVDSTREDPLAGNGSKRELMVRFWYPTGVTSDCKPAEYTSPAVWSYFSELMGVPLPEVKTNSCEDAIVATGAHPVVVFTPGYTGTFTDYTFLFEDLASRGYVVAALNHTNEATATEFPDGRIVESIFGSHLGTRLRTDEEAYTSSVIARLADLKSVLKELDHLNGIAKGPFSGRLDLSRVALAGHSLGGLTALMGVERDIRFRAGISIDPASPERVTKATETPTLLVMTGSGQWSVEECTLWSNLRGPRLALKLPGVDHLAPSDAIWLAGGAIKTGKMSPEKIMGVLRSYIAAFLDAHLRGQPADALLSGQSPDFADVIATTQKQLPCGKP
jgi:predicted dienelactone hydrolase